MNRTSTDFFKNNDAIFVAKQLLGKTLVRKFDDKQTIRSKITETEAYYGPDDLASHASKGKTPRTKIMFDEGGYVYAYLIYGVHWLLNIVTGPQDHPEAVLIRGIEACNGPGRVGKLLEIDRSFYGEDLAESQRLWIEESDLEGAISSSSRIGIDYAGEFWKNKPWRFKLNLK